MRGLTAAILISALALGGCVGKYHPPANPAGGQRVKQVVAGNVEETLARARRILIRLDWPLQTADAASGVIDTGIVQIPASVERWDCGTMLKKPIQGQFTFYDMHVRARLRVYFDAQGADETLVTLDSTVEDVLRRVYEPGGWGEASSKTGNDLQSIKGYAQCVSNGTFEREFFEFITATGNENRKAADPLVGPSN